MCDSFGIGRPSPPVAIIMDNARIHKSYMVRQYMAQKTHFHFYFTAAYSPEINFIENIFNRIKDMYKKTIVPTNK